MELSATEARRRIEDEYRTWASICEEKHGMPWPIPEEELKDASNSDLTHEIKKLKILGRTPHE